MKLYTFIENGAQRAGVEAADGQMIDLQLAHVARTGRELPAFTSLQSLIEGGPAALDEARKIETDPPSEALRTRDSITLAAPLPRPVAMRCFAVYERHLRQGTAGLAWLDTAGEPDREAAYQAKLKALDIPNTVPAPAWYKCPVYANGDPTIVVGTDAKVEWPNFTKWMDYEFEFAAVIGKRGKDISPEAANSYIFGYCILNDLSARDEQLKSMAAGGTSGKGKDFDGGYPLGPCIVTADAVPDPYGMPLRVRVNGELWATSSATEAKWKFEDCISYFSQSQTVHPGEVFALGCMPDGCSVEIRKSIKRGDVIELEADPIGVLRTQLV